MRRPKRVIGTFTALGETRQTAGLAQRANSVASSGQYFVRITLVPDIPDQPIFRRVKNRVQSRGQFDNAQASPKMPASNRNRRDRFRPHFIRQRMKFSIRHGFQIGWRFHPVKQWRQRSVQFSQNIIPGFNPVYHISRSMIKRAKSRRFLAVPPKISSPSQARSTNSAAFLRAPSTPSNDTKVALPAA